MEDKKIDRRVKYTKMFLKNALLELMKDKPIEKITPTELCRIANVNRNTFYSHYKSSRDLLDEIEEELFEDIIGCIKLENGSNFGIGEICHAIKEHGDLCKVILGSYGDRDFLLKLLATVQDMTVTKWKAVFPTSDEILLQNLFIFCANGSVSVIGKWITDGFRIDEKEIVKILEYANNSILNKK